MTTSDLAAEIFAQVASQQILAKPRTWALNEKETRDIAHAALDAAAIFTQEELAFPQKQSSQAAGQAEL
jgi:hypothetical protein